MKKKLIFCGIVLAFIASVLPISAQDLFLDDDLDSLFDSAEDIVVDESQNPPSDLTQQFDGYKPLTFSGLLDAHIGMEKLSLAGTVSFSSRANRTIGMRGSFLIESPKFNITVKEFFFDYLWFDTIYMQAGKQSITWGNTRIFSGNILDGGTDGFSIKASMPFFKAFATAVIMKDSSWYGFESGASADKNIMPRYENMSYAASLDIPIGRVALQFFGRKWASYDRIHGNPNDPLNPAPAYQYRDPALGFELKTTLWDIELYQHISMHIPFDVLFSSMQTGFDFSHIHTAFTKRSVLFVVGAYREWLPYGLPKFVVQGEYMYYKNAFIRPIADDMRFALRFGMSRFFSNTAKVGIEWQHSISDGSGSVVPVFVYAGLANLEIQLGIPVYYGKDGSVYVNKNPDPQKRMVLCGLNLSFSMKL